MPEILMLIFQKLDGMCSEGLIRSPEIPHSVPFRGCADLLLKMNQIYDKLDSPPAVRQMRRLRIYRRKFQDQMESEGTFLPETPEKDDFWEENAFWWKQDKWEDADAWLYPEPVPGKTALCVCTRYRQHNSWQGFIRIENQKIFFRSALELLYLLDDFLREQTERLNGKASTMGRMGE